MTAHAALMGFFLVCGLCLLSLCLGLVIGACIRQADQHESDETWLRDQPTDILPATEVDRQFTAIARSWNL